jgi:enediyne polyketide synthase
MADPLLLVAAADESGLRERLRERRAGGEGPLRAALVAADEGKLTERLGIADDWLGEGLGEGLRTGTGIALGRAPERPRIGFLFPGQGAPVVSDAGYLAGLRPGAAAVFERAKGLAGAERIPDELVQLSVVTASVAGLRAMSELGIEADFAVGHSVGELTAYHWAGAIDEDALLRLARRRGAVMTEHATEAGAMATIESDDATFMRLTETAGVTVACFNSPKDRVVSGPVDAVDAVVGAARADSGARALRLPVVGAFHSPLMADAVPVFQRYLGHEEFAPLARPVHSTISGAELEADADLPRLLGRQLTDPVLFSEAAREASAGADLLIEVGPGRMLSRLASEFVEVPVLPLRIGDDSAEAFLTAAGAAYVLGAPVSL